MSDTLKRADAEEMLAAWGHEDVSGLQDWQVFAWMDELDYRWTGWSWMSQEDMRTAKEVLKPAPKITAKERREADQQRLARWNGKTP
jgi:hypothetical protein